MGNIQLLDCTLRDGGYVNDWNFGHDNIINIFERVVQAKVDFIEIGFLDARRPFDINRSIMPNTECVERIFDGLERNQTKVLGMIDFGTCPIENIQPCGESYLDGIRVIFKKHIMREAMEFCQQLKELGYIVFSQMVSITSYSDVELEEFVQIANQVQPYAVSMVDTYGLLYKDNLLYYYKYLDRHLAPNIHLGYHAHNNFQLAYSNCMEVLRQDTQRSVLVDATLYGMGKSAGNAPIELVAMHMNNCFNKNYDISQLLEAIDGQIMSIHQKTPWGYNLFFYLAASNKCHPNYVQFLMDKHTLSVRSICTILEKIDEEKKLLYDKEYIAKKYYEFQKHECDDSNANIELAKRFEGKDILILGPGCSIVNEEPKIQKFIQEKKTLVISINHIPEGYPINYVFLSNPRRFVSLNWQIKRLKNKPQIIATSNVTQTKSDFDFVLKSDALMDPNAVVMDYSFVMLLKMLLDKKVRCVYCAGLDGYSADAPNYAMENMEYWYACRNAELLNEYVRKVLSDLKNQIDIVFITESKYIH